MKGERAAEGGFGRIDSGISESKFKRKTIQYIQAELPSWRDDPDRPHEEAEEKLNAQLCKFLDSRARRTFTMVRFDREEYQVGRFRADLSASPSDTISLKATTHNTIYDSILIIECKRLPAPSKDRKREYVTGGEKENGGIQRFKLGRYAPQHNLAVLIGYVQEETCAHWHERINDWISDLIDGNKSDGSKWEPGENLSAFEEDRSIGLSRCQSKHGRSGSTGDSGIELRHLWIEMNKGKS